MIRLNGKEVASSYPITSASKPFCLADRRFFVAVKSSFNSDKIDVTYLLGVFK